MKSRKYLVDPMVSQKMSMKMTWKQVGTVCNYICRSCSSIRYPWGDFQLWGHFPGCLRNIMYKNQRTLNTEDQFHLPTLHTTELRRSCSSIRCPQGDIWLWGHFPRCTNKIMYTREPLYQLRTNFTCFVCTRPDYVGQVQCISGIPGVTFSFGAFFQGV